MKPITKSRNQREGRYAGWRVTGGRSVWNWHGRPIGHERAGDGKAISLRRWQQLAKEGRVWVRA